MRRVLILLVVTLALALVLPVWLASPAQAGTAVLLYGPASIAAALQQAAAAAAGQGIRITLVTGRSPQQARQIVDGAPADILVSADPQGMALLGERGLLAEGGPIRLAATRLALIAPARSRLVYTPRPGESLAAALGGGKLAMADPYAQPSGRFARDALEKLGVWDEMAGRLIFQSDLRGVNALVQRGAVPAGISFACMAVGNPRLRIVAEFPAEIAPAVEYRMAILAGHGRPEVADAFAFLRGPQAQAILSGHGFLAPAE